MLDKLAPLPPDPLLKLIGAYRSDPRTNKIDLGVGVYRDAQGATPIMAAVKEAERELAASQATKAYVGASGDEDFVRLLGDLAFGAQNSDFVGVQSVGGTGALRLGAELMRRAGVARVLTPMPTWVNHLPILAAAGFEIVQAPFFDQAQQRILFDDLIARVRALPANSAVLLQACCHNPLGADFSFEQWQALAAAITAVGALAFIDVAYQGFGVGIEDDLQGPRAALQALPEALVAVSGAKSFGLYRERVGAVYVKCGAAQRPAAISQLNGIARADYSMPADHGASIVRLVLSDPARRKSWQAELDGMRARLLKLRAALAARANDAPALAAVAMQRGMFSTLPVTPEDVAFLRETHAIYMTESGRINVAGLREADLDRFVDALAGLPRR